jgi:coenzyme F420 hydrogenase subunit beta
MRQSETGNDRDGAGNLIGPYRQTYAGFATAPTDRRRVAAGGVVTALMKTALQEGVVDGVVLSRADFSQGRLGYAIDIVNDPIEIQNYGKSVYFNIPLEKEWKKIDSFPGQLAICVLPCHARIFRQMQKGGKRLGNLKIMLSLFCGHNNETDLWDFIFCKHNINQSDISDMRTDREHMRGYINLVMRSGETKKISFREFNTYRRLWLFSKSLCRHCEEHLGADADISVGDVFIKDFLDKKIRHSSVITRSAAGVALVAKAVERGMVTLEPIQSDSVYAAQRSIVLPSRDAGSRYWANRLFGHKAKKPKGVQFRLRTFFYYTMLLGNDKLSRTWPGRKILELAPVTALYAYIKILNLVRPPR